MDMLSRIERLLAIDTEIRKGNYPSVSFLCAKLGVKERTLFSDIKLLRVKCGAPIKFDRYRDGYYATHLNYRLPEFDLSQEDIVSLVIASKLLSCLTLHQFSERLSSTVAKILQRVPHEDGFSDTDDLDKLLSVVNEEARPFIRDMVKYSKILS